MQHTLVSIPAIESYFIRNYLWAINACTIYKKCLNKIIISPINRISCVSIFFMTILAQVPYMDSLYHKNTLLFLNIFLIFGSKLNNNNLMLQATEQSLVKIDSIISGIRMINLHIFNHLANISQQRNRDPRALEARQTSEDFRRLNVSHYQQHLKFISEYLKKCLKDLSKTRLSLSPLVYRPLRARILADEDYLRYQDHNFGVKFLFTELAKECLLNVQIYRKAQGVRVGGIAMRKLQMAFLYDLSTRYPDGLFTIDVFDSEGRSILEEVSQIFAGEKCAQCQKHLVMNYEVLALLPPTVREIQEGRKERKYYHQSCL